MTSFANDISQNLLLYQEFENLVWECTAESINKAKELLKNIDIQYVQKLIFFISNKRILSYKILADLYKETGKTIISLSQYDTLSQYFLTTNYFNKSQFSYKDVKCEYTLDDFNEPIKEGTIWKLILDDDPSEFCSFISINNILINDETFTLFHHTFHIADFVIFCGSINILKFMMINNYNISRNAIGMAFQSGKEEIIELLESHKFSFDNQLTNAIEYHHNNLALWLLDNYHCEKVTHIECILWYNTEMFFIFYDQYLQKKVKKSDFMTNRSLITLVTNQNNKPLLDFIQKHSKNLK